jgi:choline dehydrogenase-like flavoprotein
MANFNIDSKKARTYDAIVIGSGISGGWSAKELTEKGLKTLVLERGRDVQHIKDYPTTNMMPWEFEHRESLAEGSSPTQIRSQARCYNFKESSMHIFLRRTMSIPTSRKITNLLTG